jgi:TctA family transporter
MLNNQLFIVLLGIVGVYSTRSNVFDIWMMIFFGVIGYSSAAWSSSPDL